MKNSASMEVIQEHAGLTAVGKLQVVTTFVGGKLFIPTTWVVGVIDFHYLATDF